MHGEAAALARRGIHVDAAAQTCHFGAHHVHPHAPAGQRRHLLGGGKARCKDHLRQFTLGRLMIGGNEATLTRPCLDARIVQALAIVQETHDDFVAILRDLDGQFPDVRLAAGGPLGALLDAVGHRVAQDVLDGTGHAVQHVAVDLGLPPLDLQGHALVGVLAGLTHHTVEAVVDGRELHHPHTHQALLQTAAHLSLPRQVLHGGIQGAQRVLLHGGHVVDRFGQHPRHFLEAGVAVELQRVEFRLGLVGVGDLGLDLVVGLDLDLAQLQAQAVDVLGQFVDGAPDQAHLAVQTCPCNGYLARLGHHAVQQIGAHADHVLGRRGRVGRATHRRIQEVAAGLGRIMRMAIRSGLGGCLSSLLACQDLALRQRCRRLGLRRSSLGRRLLGLGSQRSLGCASLLQGLGLGSTLLGQLGMQHHLVGRHGLVIASQHGLDDRRLHRRLGQRILDLGFQFVDHLAEAHGTGHPGAALDGVEEPHQRARHRAIGRTLAPFAQVVVHLRHQLLGFLEEHRAQVRIDLVDQAGQRIALFLGLAPGSPQHFGRLLQQVLAAHLAAGL